MKSESDPPQPSPPSDWNPARPEKLPRNTAWPGGLALATTLIFWSIITSPVITVIGVILFAVALGGWISEIRHERREP